MRLIEFAQDVLRFAKPGLLLRFCWLLFGRIEVLVCACGARLSLHFFLRVLSQPADERLLVRGGRPPQEKLSP
jgi:hypothetical protein